MSEEPAGIQTSKADVWYLKEVSFGTGETRGTTKIITQNFNGLVQMAFIREPTITNVALQTMFIHSNMWDTKPFCILETEVLKLIAGNILILRGNIQILPKERTSVSYELLAQLVAEYLLTSCPEVDISAALSIMPLTQSLSSILLSFQRLTLTIQEGMDLNPLFTGATSFRPRGDGGELKLFEQAGIKLVHGWLADPQSREFVALAKTQDYDSAVNLIAEADHVSKGLLVPSDEFSASSSSQAGPSSPTQSYTREERQKIEDGKLYS